MSTVKKYTFMHYRGLMGCILFFVAAICILGSASASSEGALRGLTISSGIIIPSLFPFTVLAVFFQKSGGILWIGNKLNKITLPFFKLTGTEFSIIIISMLGGYPIGAKIIDELYKSKTINQNTAQKLLRFCINPSPAFFISVIGVNIFKNEPVGWILLISNTIACLVLNILFNKNKDKKPKYINIQSVQTNNLSDAFVNSVFSGAQIIINICAWVILFSAVAEIIKPLFSNANVYALFCPLLEISFGINEIGKTGISACYYSLLLAFGGISTICQVKQATNSFHPSLLYIFFYRIIHGASATAISFILFKIFPISTEVFSNGTEIKFTEYPLFMPAVMLLIFSVLFLMFLSPAKNQKAIDNK